MDIRKLARRNILNLHPYSSARDEYTGSGGILLDANENAFGAVIPGGYNRYPDPRQQALKNEIGKYQKISDDRIFLGNGSDEAIDLLIRAVCEPGQDAILIFPPTYGMYKVCADINNVSVRQIPLQNDFTLPTRGAADLNDPAIKIIFLCSPNNPTGNIFAADAILPLLQNQNRLVVVDEAYIDFSGTPGMLGFLSEHDNLVILQTFSKSWGLAGIRLGTAFAHPDVIDLLNKIKYPYNINILTQEKAREALRHPGALTDFVEQILAQRAYLEKALEKLQNVEHIFPSQANFLLVRFKDAPAIFKHLIEHNVIVRDRSRAVHCENCLRITVGTPSENRLLIGLLEQLEG